MLVPTGCVQSTGALAHELATAPTTTLTGIQEAGGVAENDGGETEARDDIETMVLQLAERVQRNEERVAGLSTVVEAIEKPLLAEIQRLRTALSLVRTVSDEGLVGAE